MTNSKPDKTPFLTAKWNNLVVINYEVDPSILFSHIPKYTELDTFDCKHFVSLVGFLFQDTKFLGRLPIWPFHTFEEVNLRFYIKKETQNELKRSVCFIKELVPYGLIAWTARTFYNENYKAFPMKHEWKWEDANNQSNGGFFNYSWNRSDKSEFIQATTKGTLKELADDSLESFILEHYWGYARQKNGGTKEYQVWHPPWQYWEVEEHKVHIDIGQIYGKEFSHLTLQPAHSALVAKGSDIAVYNGTRIHE